MRYLNMPIVNWTDADGNIIPIRDWREIPLYTPGTVLTDVFPFMDFSEVMSRREYYGDNSEFMAYALFEANLVKIVEAGYTLNGIRKLNIPAVSAVV